VWAAGYIVYGLVVTWVWASLKLGTMHCLKLEKKNPSIEGDRPKTKDYFIWLVLSCLPSAFFLSVTNYIALEIGSFSLVWITPLALYLASFIITFRKNGGAPRFLNFFWPELILVGLIMYLLSLVHWFLIIGHLFILLMICILSHGELYNRRPHMGYLTNFYITIALGGWLGGILVSIIAPSLFSGLYEYPLFVLAVGLTFLILHFSEFKNFWYKAHGLVVGCRLLPMALMLMLIGIGLDTNLKAETKYRCRNFYGTYIIRDVQTSQNSAEPLRELIHGVTLHGSQFIRKELRHIPTSYYYSGGNIGKVYGMVKSPRNIAVIGLGTGTTAAYGRAGDSITYFEIDPDNEQIARKWFTYLKDTKATIKVIVGDGRIALQEDLYDRNNYNLILIDAFTGDGIPTHLLTREAIQIYLNRLANQGIIVFHISSRFYNLAPIIIATSLQLDLQCVKSPEGLATPFEWSKQSRCVAVSREKETLQPLIESGWSYIENGDLKDATIEPWTDDYMNVLTPLILKFGGSKNLNTQQ
jgi:hypothetical protein